MFSLFWFCASCLSIIQTLLIEGVEINNSYGAGWKKLQNSISRNLKLISHFQCNTENWLKIPNQNVARGPIKNMQSREAGEVHSVLSRDVSQVLMWKDL